MGFQVNTRWLDGGHEWSGVDDGDIPPPEAVRFAMEDVADIHASQIFVCFTEEPRSGSSRGGRHVEYGMATMLGKRIVVVGPRENVFYTLPGPIYVQEWQEAKDWLWAWMCGVWS